MVFQPDLVFLVIALNCSDLMQPAQKFRECTQLPSLDLNTMYVNFNMHKKHYHSNEGSFDH